MSDQQQARFIAREACIACGSTGLKVVATGPFRDGFVGKMLATDPWGESPLPYLQAAAWELTQCIDCAQTFQRQLLAPEWQERRFTHWMTKAAMETFERMHRLNTPASHFERARERWVHLLAIEKLTRGLRGEGPARTLDVGCGWGEFVQLAQSAGFDACGIDRSSDRRARTELGGGLVFLDFKALDAHDPRPFHAITMFQVLEHLERPLEVLREIHAHMTLGGILLIEVPDCEGVTDINDVRSYRLVDPLDHVNAFTPRTLRQIAERAGFQAIPTPGVFATADGKRVAKGIVKRVLQPFLKSTSQVFVKQ